MLVEQITCTGKHVWGPGLEHFLHSKMALGQCGASGQRADLKSGADDGKYAPGNSSRRETRELGSWGLNPEEEGDHPN